MDIAAVLEFVKLVGSVFSLVKLVNDGDLAGSLDGAQLSA
ncbi:hypothetical protein CCANI_06765 [Corynebacterium canis]|nr:hypothetical protein CCANI_06765 [Corynebacterium canis]